MDKKIVVFDIETTGLDKEVDQIIQFSAIKIDRNTYEVCDKIDFMIEPDGQYSITIQAYLKHHIHPNMLAGKPHLADVADKIISFFGDCDVLTYNGLSFDIPFLVKSFVRIGKKIDFSERKIYDAYLEERRRHGLMLEDVYKRYNGGKSMEESGLTAHNALSDVFATLSIFQHQSNDRPVNEEKLVSEDNVIVSKPFNNTDQFCFNIGKYKDLPLSYVASFDQGYLRWCVDRASFLDSTKNLIKQYLN